MGIRSRLDNIERMLSILLSNDMMDQANTVDMMSQAAENTIAILERLPEQNAAPEERHGSAGHWRVTHLGVGETICDQVYVQPSGALEARTYVEGDTPDIVTTKFFAPGGWLRAEQIKKKES